MNLLPTLFLLPLYLVYVQSFKTDINQLTQLILHDRLTLQQRQWEESGFPASFLGSDYAPLLTLHCSHKNTLRWSLVTLAPNFYGPWLDLPKVTYQHWRQFPHKPEDMITGVYDKGFSGLCEANGLSIAKCTTRFLVMKRTIGNILNLRGKCYRLMDQTLEKRLEVKKRSYRLLNTFMFCLHFAIEKDKRYDNLYAATHCPNPCKKRSQKLSLDYSLGKKRNLGFNQLFAGQGSAYNRDFPCKMRTAKTRECQENEDMLTVERYMELSYKCVCASESESKFRGTPSFWNSVLKLCVWDVNWVAAAWRTKLLTSDWNRLEYPYEVLGVVKCNLENTFDIKLVGEIHKENPKMGPKLHESFGEMCICKKGYYGKKCEYTWDPCEGSKGSDLPNGNVMCQTKKGGTCTSYRSIFAYKCTCGEGYKRKQFTFQPYASMDNCFESERPSIVEQRKKLGYGHGHSSDGKEKSSQLADLFERPASCYSPACIHGVCIKGSKSEKKKYPLSEQRTSFCMCDLGWTGDNCDTPELIEESWDHWTTWSFCFPSETDDGVFISRQRTRERKCQKTGGQCEYGTIQKQTRVCRPRPANRFNHLTYRESLADQSIVDYVKDFANMLQGYYEQIYSFMYWIAFGTTGVCGLLFIRVLILIRMEQPDVRSLVSSMVTSARNTINSFADRLSFADIGKLNED